MTTISFLERALSAAMRGFYVFPVKVDTGPDGKRLVNPIGAWRTAGTLDPDVIRSWWTPGNPRETWWPAIDCGRSGIVVADLDVKNGIDGPGNWRALPGVLPYPFAAVKTPSGGQHLAYLADPDHPVGIDASGKVAPGVDIRGDGGLVFVHGWIARPRDLPRLPAVVWERMGPTPILRVVRDRPAAKDAFDAPARSFTPEQAAAFVAGPLSRLRSAPVGTINTRTNEAACALSHFVPVFWSVEEAYTVLCAALAETAYDGRTWRASRFRAVLDGTRPPGDSWTAALAEGAPEPAQEPDGAVLAEGSGPAPEDPAKIVGSGFFADAKLAEFLASHALRGRYIWTPGAGWYAWDGRRWAECGTELALEALRREVVRRFDAELGKARKDPDRIDLAREWKKTLSGPKLTTILKLARGIEGVHVADDRLDADPDALNTPGGIVDLRSGAVRAHDPAALMTMITSGSYVPGLTHPDWAMALSAVRKDTVDWLAMRLGQGATGWPAPDGRLLVLQGVGSNGKSALTTDGVIPALGGYGRTASTKLFAAGEHSTERAELRGARLLVAEELAEGRSIDVQALKQLQDVGQITARRVYRDNMTFVASHTLITTTNYVPVVAETDHGTWRRLALVRFPYRFLRPGETTSGPDDRQGDPGLKARLRLGQGGRHDAVVTWLVEGAIAWHVSRADGGDASMDLPASVELDTRAWRLDADRIMAYVEDRLVHSPSGCVLRTELSDDFNGWLQANGHAVWSESTFRNRFEMHESVMAWGVVAVKTRDLAELSRRYAPLGIHTPSVTRAWVWRGVTFRNDQGSGDHGNSGLTARDLRKDP